MVNRNSLPRKKYLVPADYTSRMPIDLDHFRVSYGRLKVRCPRLFSSYGRTANIFINFFGSILFS